MSSIPVGDLPTTVLTKNQVTKKLITDNSGINFNVDSEQDEASYGIGAPDDTIFADTQADLEAELTASLIVSSPGNTIYKNKDFEQTVGYKIGLGASLYDQSIANIVPHRYKNASEAMYANQAPASAFKDCRLLYGRKLSNDDQDSILFNLVGDGIGPADEKVNVTIHDNVQINGFLNYGPVEDVFAFLVTALVGFTDYLEYGFTILNSNIQMSCVAFTQPQGATAKRDALAIFNDVAAGPILVDIADTNFVLPGEEAIFIDPLAHASSRFNLINNKAIGTTLLKIGDDGTYTAAADAGGGFTTFTSTTHGILENEPVSVTDLTGGSFSISRRAKNVTANTFDLEVAFTSTGTGDWTTTSLGAVISDSRIMAVNNVGLADTTSAAEITNGVDLVVPTAVQGVMEPIQEAVPAPGDFIVDPATKNFSVDTSTGIATYTGLEPLNDVEIRYTAKFTGDGPSQDIDAAIHINSVEQTKSRKSGSTNPTLTYTGGLFDLQPGDEIQLYKENNTNTDDTDVTDFNVFIK